VPGAHIEPFRDEGAVGAYAQALERKVAKLEAESVERKVAARDVMIARAGIHASSSAVLYTLIAAFSSGPLLEHPHLAVVIASLNLLAWTISSAVIKFG
jgi:hypothetical protein